MKLLSRTKGGIRKLVAAIVTIGVAAVLPMAATAASQVAITANTTVANATKSAGTYNWSASTAASYNEVVAVQVVYNNTEDPSSDKLANDLHIKVTFPTNPGTTQTVTTTTSASNSNIVKGSATVTLNRADAYLQYIPGTATWKHATSANADINGKVNVVTQKVSDDVVLNANGINLGNEHPCQAGSIVVQARVMVPGLTIDKYVRVKGTSNWARSITAKPGETVQYQIAYKNTGNTTQNEVAIRDQLPANVTYVTGSAQLKNTNFPNATGISDAVVASNGVIIGNYLPGAAGYVMFEAKLPAADKLACGSNNLRNLAFVQPKGMNYYYNTADVNITKDCEQPKTPVYSCDLLTVEKGDNRKVTASVKYTATPTDTVKLKTVTYNWGDGTTPAVTDQTTKSYQYNKDGTYTVSVKLLFNVNGSDKYAPDTQNCVKTVSFTTPGTPETPETPETPTELPNTGAGSVIGIFGLVTVVSAIVYRLFLSRKVSRN